MEEQAGRQCGWCGRVIDLERWPTTKFCDRICKSRAERSRVHDDVGNPSGGAGRHRVTG
jgi:hypothetical protein